MASVAFKLVPSGILSRSLFPLRRVASSASSRLFNANAGRYHDEDDERSYSFHRRYDNYEDLGPLGEAGGMIRPAFGSKHTDDDVQLRWDMPGLGKEDVKVYVEHNTLVVKGESKKEDDDETTDKYSTRIDLPEKVFETGAIKAEMENGVLKVRLPKIKGGEREVLNIYVD